MPEKYETLYDELRQKLLGMAKKVQDSLAESLDVVAREASVECSVSSKESFLAVAKNRDPIEEYDELFVASIDLHSRYRIQDVVSRLEQSFKMFPAIDLSEATTGDFTCLLPVTVDQIVWSHPSRPKNFSLKIINGCLELPEAPVVFSIAPSEDDELSREDYTHVIALVHGIRDPAHWSHVIESFDARGVAVVHIRYGYFNALRFLCPLNLTGRPVKIVVGELKNLRNIYPNAKQCIIAHSFGTYVTLKALQNDPHIKLWKLVFCGSVADDLLNWVDYEHRIGRPEYPTKDYVVNDCGTGDYWPVLGAAFGWRFGKAGTVGFLDTFVTNRFHKASDGTAGRHSLYFEPEFVNTYWRPFLLDDRPPVKGTGKQGEDLWWSKIFYDPIAQFFAKIINLAFWLVLLGTVLWLVCSGYTWLWPLAQEAWNDSFSPKP